MRTRRSHRQGEERGAILVEFVFVVPLFMILVLGIFEIGKAWEANQAVVQASRSGARTVSQLGTYARADQEALLAVVSTFGSDAADVTRVIIFEADSNGDMHPQCMTTPSASIPSSRHCNRYDATDLANLNDPTYFASATSCSGGASAHWCPTARNNVQRNATYVGVYVEFEEQYQTGMFGGGTYTITEAAVMRIEPDAG